MLLKELVVEVRVESRDSIVPNLPASQCAVIRQEVSLAKAAT